MSLRFSVITPSFCQGRFIKHTVQSVLAQKMPDMEYVICDGGSQDETIEILKLYNHKIRWISEPDRGQADAVNKGISMTTGDVIAWINSDDIYYSGAFEAVKAVFEAYPEVQVVYGDADWIDEEGKIIAPFPTEPWNYDRLKSICYICQPAVFFRRSLVEKFGNLDASLEYCMDYELWLRYGKNIDFHYLPQKLAGSRMYKTNKTLGKRLEAHYEINEMLARSLKKVPESWIFGYALIKVEETTNLSRYNDTQVRQFTKALIWNSFWGFFQWKKWVPPIILLKMVFWWFFPNLSWFRRSILSNPKSNKSI
ncbi:MAG: glycosyltransferase family 2 protein [Cyanobacteriota bacterium]